MKLFLKPDMLQRSAPQRGYLWPLVPKGGDHFLLNLALKLLHIGQTTAGHVLSQLDAFHAAGIHNVDELRPRHPLPINFEHTENFIATNDQASNIASWNLHRAVDVLRNGSINFTATSLNHPAILNPYCIHSMH